VTRVLLITGARSLATRPGAEAWARGLIAEALAGCDLLIVGDAPGPDAWARTEAGREGVECHEYLTLGIHAGMIAEHCGIAAPHIDRRWDRPSMHGRRYPLHRNAAMVDDVKALAMTPKWAAAPVLALLDGLKVDAPGKRATRGTEHTVGLARAAGLTVRQEVWR
jgi:hypothetical protein